MGKFITNDRIDLLLKRGIVEEALREPVKQLDPQQNGIARFVRSRTSGQSCIAEDAVYVGVTLGDFLYDYLRINPEVVHGVEFARSADVDSVLSCEHEARLDRYRLPRVAFKFTGLRGRTNRSSYLVA